ncbi:MAG: hypothetical protein ACK5KL_08410 [Dysgonomonas sp.]
MDLQTYYNQAGYHRFIFRDHIMNKCGINKVTFYRWVNMKSLPSKLDREAISEYTKIPVETLFPSLIEQK